MKSWFWLTIVSTFNFCRACWNSPLISALSWPWVTIQVRGQSSQPDSTGSWGDDKNIYISRPDKQFNFAILGLRNLRFQDKHHDCDASLMVVLKSEILRPKIANINRYQGRDISMFYCNLSLAVKQQCFPLKEASDQSYAVDMPEHARTMPVLTGCCLHQTCIGLVMACTAMIALLHIKKMNFQVNILIVQLQLYLGDILLFFISISSLKFIAKKNFYACFTFYFLLFMFNSCRRNLKKWKL